MENHHVVAGLLIVDVLELGHDLKSGCLILGICVKDCLSGVAEPVAVRLCTSDLNLRVCNELLINFLEISYAESTLPSISRCAPSGLTFG